MYEQYPHTIAIQLQPEFEQDPSGNLQPKAGTGGTFSSECRAEPAGEGDILRGNDGNEIAFAFVVYMPKTETKFLPGDIVEISADGSQFPGTVKRQYNGQFNTRLWV